MAQQTVIETELSPRTNPHLIGHTEAETALLDAWYAGKMPHAWLISGPRGIGKATLAYRLARFVLSQGAAQAGRLFGVDNHSLVLDSDHPVFRRIVAGSHGDLLVLEMKEGKEINVEEARKIASFLRLTPSESEWRVVIVDSIDHMNRNAANAILKILEEPPVNALILLVSHLPGKILPTIRSRCRQLRMPPLNNQAFAEVLSKALPEVTADEIARLHRIAEGSPGLALDMHAKSGLVYYARIVEILGRLPKLDTTAIHTLGDEVSAKGDGAAWHMLVYMFGYFFYQLALHATGQEREATVSGEHEVLAQMLAKSPLETWLELWEKIRQSLEDVTRINLDRKHVVVNVFAGIAG